MQQIRILGATQQAKKITRLSKKNLLIYYDIPERVDPVNNVHSDRRL